MSTGAPHPTPDPPVTGEHRLSAGTIARYAVGSLGTGGFATLPGLVLTYYLTDNLGVAAAFAGVVITIAKLWDVIIDPVIGALTDRQRAFTGSRRGYMLLGACSLPFLFALTFAVPPGLAPAVGAIWVLIAFTATATAFSLFQVPYIALPAELTPGYDERTRLLTWRVIVLTFAILLFGAGGPILRDLTGDPTTGYLLMGAVSGVMIGVGMLISTTVAARGARHISRANAARLDVRAHYVEGLQALRRSQPFRVLLLTYVLQALATGLMLAGAQYLATWVMHSEAAVTLLFASLIAPALIAAPVWGVIARRIGKTRAFRLASTLFIVAAIIIAGALVAPGDWLYAPVALAGIAYAGMQSLPMAMLPDVISADADGTASAGAFSGVWTAGETVGFAISASAFTAVLALTGYISSTADVSVTQPESAVAGIVIAFSVIPAVLTLLSLVSLSRYRLTKHDIDAVTPTA